ncbi:MAG: 50S ribosomal protein L31 [Gammaproteobacteria bacterium]
MRPDIHPAYQALEVECSCGNRFATRSALKSGSLRVEVCNECHPFFTGKHKIVDTQGRVDQFMRRYGGVKNQKDAS